MQTGKERVRRAVAFGNPDRVPRDLWALPWFADRHPDFLRRLRERFPCDVGGVPSPYRPSPRWKGDPYALGRHTDDWGCTFENHQAGAIGEVKKPILTDLSDWRNIVRPPYETLPEDLSAARDSVNRALEGETRYVRCCACPRPWERYQFLRGSFDALCDAAAGDDPDFLGALGLIHEFYLREVEFWATTDVDCIQFMDDWGAQRQLLIRPEVWRAVFKPLYRDYCDIAHAHGKQTFMHSDGYTLEIIPDLIEAGVDSANLQLFTMDFADLAPFRGRLAFWGEIDRQHVLTSADPEDGRRAVRKVRQTLETPAGGVIAEIEAGLATNPAVVEAIYDEWSLPAP